MLTAAASASAATVYVSNSAPVVAGGKSCAQPGFKSVQAALDAGPNQHVKVCPGTYEEQIEILTPAKLEATSGIGTAKLVMPASAVDSKTACDTKNGSQNIDEISICTSGAVTLKNLNIEAEIPLETCAGGLYGVFVGDGGTLKAQGDSIVGASTTLDNFKGCQHGIALGVGSSSREEVGHATLKSVTVSGYEKNGPTVTFSGSTLSMKSSTIVGEGPTPFIAQNGVEVAFGGKGTIKSSSVSGNECNVAVCSESVEEQASGVLFYQAAQGSSISGSAVKENDLGVYYASGSATEPATAQVSISKDVLTSNRYEGILLEEGKAALKSDTINGTGRVGIDLFQTAGQASASESSATGTKVEGQTEAAVKVESDKAAGDTPGKFTFSGGSFHGDGTVLINESNDFTVIF
ncbi:MAG TPA: right-handed parallel beta-helix repeat-containing protein [Solirubrobacteraceae bacterium]